MDTKSPKKLNRFTQLPVLLDFLERGKLVLLDPKKWDDKNDSLIIEEYKVRANVKKVFALCFALGDETIHHWKTFANGSGGCCIEFMRDDLVSIFDNIGNVRHGKVEYMAIKETKSNSFKLEAIPFIKRLPYQPENEYRVIWEGEIGEFFEIDVPIEFIKRVTFSQQMPETVFDTIKSMLIRNYPNLNQKISRSTIYENKTWIKNFRENK